MSKRINKCHKMSRVHYFQRGNTEKVTSNEAIFLSYALTKCKNLREHCVMVGILMESQLCIMCCLGRKRWVGGSHQSECFTVNMARSWQYAHIFSVPWKTGCYRYSNNVMYFWVKFWFCCLWIIFSFAVSCVVCS